MGNAARSARYTRRNADSRKQANSHYARWSAAELEVAARPDLTDYETGLMLGRTMNAVKRARQRYGLVREYATTQEVDQ